MNTKVEEAKGTKVQKSQTVKNEATNEKKTLRELAKIEAQKKAIEFLGTKTVNGKEINPSRKTVKAQTTIELYKDKAERTLNESKLLVNAFSKIDNLSASKVYNKMIINKELHSYFLELSGQKKLPTFKEFSENLAVKFAFSEWDILGALVKMNPKHKINAKIERQNKATKAK